MAGTKQSRVSFPFAGLDRRQGYQFQPPYTTLDCVNVRPRDVFERRMRGGSRPGTTKAYEEVLGPTILEGTLLEVTFLGTESLITATASIFSDRVIGKVMTFVISGATFVIVRRISATQVAVLGDASGQSPGDEFRIALGDPIRLMETCNPISNLVAGGNPLAGQVGRWTDLFYASPDHATPIDPTYWSLATGYTEIPNLLQSTLPNQHSCFNTLAADVGAVRTVISDIDTTSEYQIHLQGSFSTQRNQSGQIIGLLGKEWHILAKMDNATPNYILNGVRVVITPRTDSDTLFQVFMNFYVAGVSTGFIANVPHPLNGTFVLTLLLGGQGAAVFVDGTLCIPTQIHTLPLANTRMGFGMRNNPGTGGWPGQLVRTEQFTCVYKIGSSGASLSPGGERKAQILVASAGGAVYYEDGPSMVQLVSQRQLASNRLLHGIDYAGKLYIADNDTPRILGDGATMGGGGTRLDHAGVVDWTSPQYGINTFDDVVVIDSPTTGEFGVFAIAALGPDFVTIDGAIADGAVVNFLICRGPKIFDPTALTLELLLATPGKGAAPPNCPLIASYRDRLVLAGHPPHVWYMSRQGNPLDWNYGADPQDPGRPVAGTATDTGRVGEPLTAILASGNDYCLLACTNSLWIIRGDPAFGGSLDNISREIGALSSAAICRSPAGVFFVLTKDGLYIGENGIGGGLRSLSRERLPNELLNFDEKSATILLEWDIEDNGLHIYLTPLEQRDVLHWFFDLETASWWPMRSPGWQHPTATVSHAPIDRAGRRLLLAGGRDGFIRFYDRTNGTDDGFPIESYAMIGPMKMNDEPYAVGILNELDIRMAQESGNIDLAIMAGMTPEQARTTSAAPQPRNPRYIVPVSAGVNPRLNPRVSGVDCFLRLTGRTGLVPWAFEDAKVTFIRGGRTRFGRY